MTLPTTEITIFDASDAFRANPELLIPAVQEMKTHGVVVPVYVGLEARNSDVGLIFVQWDSYEHHKEIMEAPFYADLTKGLASAVAGLPKIHHVQFSAPTVALDKPITEIVLFTLKNPENRPAVIDILSKISEASEKVVVFGQTREDENKYVLVCGWPTMEAHWETAAKPEFSAALKQLFSLTDKDGQYHTKLTKY